VDIYKIGREPGSGNGRVKAYEVCLYENLKKLLSLANFAHFESCDFIPSYFFVPQRARVSDELEVLLVGFGLFLARGLVVMIGAGDICCSSASEASLISGQRNENVKRRDLSTRVVTKVN